MQLIHKYLNCIITEYTLLSVSARNSHLQTDLYTKEFWLSIRKTYVTAGPQQWRFINYITKGLWKSESVCWRTRLYLLGWDIIAFPAGRAWILRRQHFPGRTLL